MAALSFLDRERIIAPANYNRWLIPPAALAIHLAIGQVYAFSVFKIPLNRLGGWSESSLAWIFSIAIVCLGVSAAVWGTWLARPDVKGNIGRRLSLAPASVKLMSRPLPFLSFGVRP